MPENNLYYIYIDSKIIGAIDQLWDYFQADIFNADDCIYIYFKYYKEIEKYIRNIFSNTNIKYKFIYRNSDLVFIPNKTVFYLFNAQSNCRIVTNRDLTHIFVTHGESHKLASIKPIIRIYDYVVTSGQIGIERFLKAGIFNSQNINDELKVIPMGDTFVGQNSYIYDSNKKAIVYAPTWEGGVLNENYSSIGDKATEVLLSIILKYKITTLYIQPHPNLGHRDKKYIHLLVNMINSVADTSAKVVLVKSKFSFWEKLKLKNCTFEATGSVFNVQGAIVDISAMEMQFINRDIPTLVLFKESSIKNLIIPTRVQYLYNIHNSLENLDANHLDFNGRWEEISINKDYLFSFYKQDLKQLTFKQRISWLCKFASDNKAQQNKSLFNSY